MEMVNPLAAFREGYDTVQGLYDARTRRQAGNALAQGDYRAGANVLMQGGMLDQGQELLNYDQRNRAAEVEAMKRQQEEAKAAQVQSLKTMLGGAQSLLQVPPEQRAAAYRAQVRPLLEAQGVPPELLAKFDQSGFTDAELQPFVTTLGGELQKPEWQFIPLNDGGVALGDKRAGTLNVIREPAAKQARVIEAQDGLWQETSPGKWERVATFAPQAKTFAPKAPRGGKGKPAQGGSNQLPAGFVLE